MYGDFIMPSPFPGMDPYLEDPDLWSGFHHTFLNALQQQISPAIKPNYFVRVEERVYVITEDDPAYRFIVPDLRVIAVKRRSARRAAIPAGALAIAEPIEINEPSEREVHEYRLEVVDRVDRNVVCVIELLSPTNKVPQSAGRASFLQKRKAVLKTTTHWMEIDLLREGVRTANVGASSGAEYQVYLSRSGEPRSFFVWPILLREPLPVVGIPLLAKDKDIPLNLQTAFSQVYEIGGYEVDIDYRVAASPSLDPQAAKWARERIRQANPRK